MNDQTAIPQKKLLLLGNILLVVACLGLIGWVLIMPLAIIGLRCLGALLIVQFIAGWIVDSFIARPTHGEIFTHSVVSELPVMLLVVGPNLSTGILFLILSWVLEYGRRIKEEQALTI